MIDDFSSAQGGAVLVAQIQAGGVGLNIQAASVVVICEPQVKPTTEWQAIARAHRMGQLQSVQVHRLLSEEGVDLRLYQLLARKREIFEDFARQSETAESAPEAYDVSEAALAKEVIAAERERLFGRSDPDSFPESDKDEPQESVVEEPPAVESAPKVVPNFASSEPAVSAVSSVGDADTRTRLVLPSEKLSRAGDPLPYTVFSGTFPPLAETPADKVIDNILCIVDAEGPMTGYRIHAAYFEASGDLDDRANARILNQSITQAESGGLILSDNPLGAEGVKPKTFRLPTQPPVVRRELGPRSLTQVPPGELVSPVVTRVETAAHRTPESVTSVETLSEVRQPAQTNPSVSGRALDPEPPSGSIVRFSKSGFLYVAVRNGDRWETSATSSGQGFIDKTMSWDDMWAKARNFEIATRWAEVTNPATRDDRLTNKAIVRFVRDGKLVGAIAIDRGYSGSNSRSWYTTMSKNSGGKKVGSWSEILPNPQHVEVATGWEPIGPLEVSG